MTYTNSNTYVDSVDTAIVLETVVESEVVYVDLLVPGSNGAQGIPGQLTPASQASINQDLLAEASAVMAATVAAARVSEATAQVAAATVQAVAASASAAAAATSLTNARQAAGLYYSTIFV